MSHFSFPIDGYQNAVGFGCGYHISILLRICVDKDFYSYVINLVHIVLIKDYLLV